MNETDEALVIKYQGHLCDIAARDVDVATDAHEHGWCETE